jgi:hypothetical protein
MGPLSFLLQGVRVCYRLTMRLSTLHYSHTEEGYQASETEAGCFEARVRGGAAQGEAGCEGAGPTRVRERADRLRQVYPHSIFGQWRIKRRYVYFSN